MLHLFGILKRDLWLFRRYLNKGVVEPTYFRVCVMDVLSPSMYRWLTSGVMVFLLLVSYPMQIVLGIVIGDCVLSGFKVSFASVVTVGIIISAA